MRGQWPVGNGSFHRRPRRGRRGVAVLVAGNRHDGRASGEDLRHRHRAGNGVSDGAGEADLQAGGRRVAVVGNDECAARRRARRRPCRAWHDRDVGDSNDRRDLPERHAADVGRATQVARDLAVPPRDHEVRVTLVRDRVGDPVDLVRRWRDGDERWGCRTVPGATRIRAKAPRDVGVNVCRGHPQRHGGRLRAVDDVGERGRGKDPGDLGSREGRRTRCDEGDVRRRDAARARGDELVASEVGDCWRDLPVDGCAVTRRHRHVVCPTRVPRLRGDDPRGLHAGGARTVGRWWHGNRPGRAHVGRAVDLERSRDWFADVKDLLFEANLGAEVGWTECHRFAEGDRDGPRPGVRVADVEGWRRDLRHPWRNGVEGEPPLVGVRRRDGTTVHGRERHRPDVAGRIDRLNFDVKAGLVLVGLGECWQLNHE